MRTKGFDKKKTFDKFKYSQSLDRVKRSVNVMKILKHYRLSNFNKSGDWINGSCPLPSHGGPDHNPSFGITDDQGNERNGSFKCFKCGKGDIIKFVMAMERTDFKGAIQFLNKFRSSNDPYSFGVLEKELEELEESEQNESGQAEIQPTYFPNMSPNLSIVAKYMIENEKRNFSRSSLISVVKDYSVGVAYYRGALRIVIPIVDEHGRWISFFAQNPMDNEDKLFPKGAKTGRLLFGVDKWIGKSDFIILAEGVWDALKIASFGLPSVACFSTSFTEAQADIITEHFNKVFVAFDADEGGEGGFMRVANYLFPAVSLHKIKMKEGKDPCTCTKKEFIRAYKKAERLEFHNETVLNLF